MWLFFAILSSIFAALTSVFAKAGLDRIDSSLATALRTCIVLVMAWLVVLVSGSYTGFSGLDKKNWLFLILSGLSTGFSWLCYYKALQSGCVSKVVSIDKLSIVITVMLSVIFLHEQFSIKTALACIFIAVGCVLMSI